MTDRVGPELVRRVEVLIRRSCQPCRRREQGCTDDYRGGKCRSTTDQARFFPHGSLPDARPAWLAHYCCEIQRQQSHPSDVSPAAPIPSLASQWFYTCMSPATNLFLSWLDAVYD